MSSRNVMQSTPMRKGKLLLNRLVIADISKLSVLIRVADAIIRDIRLLSD